MKNELNKLIEIGSDPLSNIEGDIELNLFNVNSSLISQLSLFLKQKNGFYAFESSLHVFPINSINNEIGLNEWNAKNLWISDYQGMADNAVFFAEDIFGGQFCIKSDGVHTFDPEIGETEFFAADLNEWAKLLLKEYKYLTGYPLAHDWQEHYGVLMAGKRLIPKVPLVLQGEFTIDNLAAIDAVKGMKWRADIAVQICGISDGESINLKLID